MVGNLGPVYVSSSVSWPLIQLLKDTRSCIIASGIKESLDGRLHSFFLSLFLRQDLRRWSQVILEIQLFVLFMWTVEINVFQVLQRSASC